VIICGIRMNRLPGLALLGEFDLASLRYLELDHF
jgi:hypothetical protein